MGINQEIAIVTGAARGIGKATSLRFKKEGITVIETDILPDSENKGVSEKPQMEPKGETMIHDVSDEASWSELVESVRKRPLRRLETQCLRILFRELQWAAGGMLTRLLQLSIF